MEHSYSFVSLGAAVLVGVLLRRRRLPLAVLVALAGWPPLALVASVAAGLLALPVAWPFRGHARTGRRVAL